MLSICFYFLLLAYSLNSYLVPSKYKEEAPSSAYKNPKARRLVEMAEALESSATAAPSGLVRNAVADNSFETRIANLEYENRILREENSKMMFCIENLETAVFGRKPTSEPASKKLKR